MTFLPEPYRPVDRIRSARRAYGFRFFSRKDNR